MKRKLWCPNSNHSVRRYRLSMSKGIAASQFDYHELTDIIIQKPDGQVWKFSVCYCQRSNFVISFRKHFSEFEVISSSVRQLVTRGVELLLLLPCKLSTNSIYLMRKGLEISHSNPDVESLKLPEGLPGTEFPVGIESTSENHFQKRVWKCFVEVFRKHKFMFI